MPDGQTEMAAEAAAGLESVIAGVLAVAVLEALVSARPGLERRRVQEVVCAWLEDVSAGSPDFDPFGAMRADAAWWADVATPAELEAYVGAGLRALGETRLLLPARKRLLVALWQALPEDERRAFVRRVDPAGRFHRGPA